VSAATYRYVLWACGSKVGKYKTLGQALLGALWRSKKLEQAVYVWETGSSLGLYKVLYKVEVCGF